MAIRITRKIPRIITELLNKIDKILKESMGWKCTNKIKKKKRKEK
jgi:hypothetical protein